MRIGLMLVSGALMVSACSTAPPPQPAQQQASGYKPVVSLNEIMVNIVDPHSHELWDAVASPAKAPKTDEDWRNIRHAAITLAACGEPDHDERKWAEGSGLAGAKGLEQALAGDRRLQGWPHRWPFRTGTSRPCPRPAINSCRRV